MADHTPTPWFKNRKFEVGPRPRTDDQSDGMLHPVADVFGDNKQADAAFIVKAVNNHEALVKALQLLEKAEAFHMNCDECDGADVPELCEKCFPYYDDARTARRQALAAVGGSR